MRYTRIPETTFKELQLNAGILVKDFTPDSGEVTGLVGATSGGMEFSATPAYDDFGADIDNCPKNTLELKKLTDWEIKLSGTFVTFTKDSIKAALGAADAEGNKITPRRDVAADDFEDMWWVGDYSDKNGDTKGGAIAIHMMNTLSTGGFKITSSDKAKGKAAFEFTAHFSMDAQDTVPFEIYVIEGADED